MRWDTRWRIAAAVMLPALATALTLLLMLSRAHLSHVRVAVNHEIGILARKAQNPTLEALARNDRADLSAITRELAADEGIAAARVRDTRGRVLASHETDPPGALTRIGALFIAVTAFKRLELPTVRLRLARGRDSATLELMPDQAWAYSRYAAAFLPAAGLTAALMVIAALLASVMANSIGSPLRRAKRFARRLEGGHLDERLRTDSSGEFGEFEAAMNAMAGQLAASREALEDQVRNTTSELRQTLQAVEVQNVELDVARKRALEASQVKSEFLANVSHEIRTPINGIVGFADLLYHSPLNAEQQDYVDTIRESCSNLLTIINDILDFSKIEAGKLVVDNIAFDIRDCVEEVLSLLAPSAYGKGLELAQLVYADVPTKLWGDPLRLRQVLTNLVHNAIKFTPRGHIVVRVMLESDSDERAELRVCVTDTGIGLDKADRDKLFQAFSQADTSLTRRFGGTGLGLVISRKLVEQMGGVVDLESEPAQGSTFSFTVDLLKQRTTAAHEPATPLDGRRALLADPGALTRLALRHQLEGWGVAVEEAECALLPQRLAEAGWDLLILGLGRRELNAGASHSALSAARNHGIPAVVLASTVDRNELRSLYQRGAVVSLPRTVRRQTVFRELCRIVAPSEGAPRLAVGAALEHPSPQAPDQPGVQEAASARILVVDDNAINRKLITTIAARNGIHVVEAADGNAAVDACHREQFDVIFMDIQMPGMSGEIACQEIRALPSADSIPRIIALTANAMHGERERLLHAGLDECLVKPVSEAQILEAARSRSFPCPVTATNDIPPRELHHELQEMLVAELPQLRHDIRHAFHEGDLATMRERVHKLHGAVSVCRLPGLKQACAGLEESLLQGERVAVPVGLEALLNAIGKVLEETG